MFPIRGPHNPLDQLLFLIEEYAFGVSVVHTLYKEIKQLRRIHKLFIHCSILLESVISLYNIY